MLHTTLQLLSNVTLALQLMGYGLLTVFTVLILFILITIVLVRLFPDKDEKENSDPS